MKETEELKTITLGYAGNPTLVVCPGHVDIKTFNKATKAEGWQGGLQYTKDDLNYEYGIMTEKKYKRVAPSHKEAKPFTTCPWD